MDGMFLLILLLGVTPPMMAASVHGEEWKKKNPDKLWFTWGFFVIYTTLLSYMLLGVVSIWNALRYGDVPLFVLTVAVLAVVIFLVKFSFQRRRWALVLLTIASLNPLFMLINLFYLSNRWQELGLEAPNGRTVRESLLQQPKDVRAALFLSVAWGVCVPAYVFLFRPYGYMSDHDTVHMVLVVLVPIIVGLGLFYTYRKFVR